MAKITNLNTFNENRIQNVKLQNSIEEAIILTVDETKNFLNDLIVEELNVFSEIKIRERKIELEERLNFKLKFLENELVRHINEKIDKITEHIVSLTVNRVIEEEVSKRLEIKLDKIKKQL